MKNIQKNQEKLKQQVSICHVHIARIKIALEHIEPLLPLDDEKVLHFSDEQLGFLELLTGRLGKLQDTMGKHIFPLTLNLLSEWNESQSMIDILNRLEKLHFIKQATFWQYLREVRNEITHEYENKPEQQAEKILLAIKAAKELLIVWNHFENESKSSSALKSYF